MGDVYVIAEQRGGTVLGVTHELIAKAAEVAPALGGRAVAVLLGGPGVGDAAAGLAPAARAIVVEDERLADYTPEAYKATAVEVLSGREPRLVLVGNTSVGLDLAAGLSVALDLPLVAYATSVGVEDGRVVTVSRIYGGKADVEVEIDGPGIVSVQAGAFKAAPGGGAPEVEEVKSPAALEGVRTRFLRSIEPQGGDVDITREPILVSVGRGIQNADNIGIMQGLADALGGSLAASRPITDNGWLPKTRQVGKSGLGVKPKLYLCAGISGAPEHLEGMRDAELIIAVNKDEGAPIFEVAHFGVVGDLFEIVPALTEKLTS
jgi:electron transfer flavoprotein alpha subunit